MYIVKVIKLPFETWRLVLTDAEGLDKEIMSDTELDISELSKQQTENNRIILKS